MTASSREEIPSMSLVGLGFLVVGFGFVLQGMTSSIDHMKKFHVYLPDLTNLSSVAFVINFIIDTIVLTIGLKAPDGSYYGAYCRTLEENSVSKFFHWWNQFLFDSWSFMTIVLWLCLITSGGLLTVSQSYYHIIDSLRTACSLGDSYVEVVFSQLHSPSLVFYNSTIDDDLLTVCMYSGDLKMSATILLIGCLSVMIAQITMIVEWTKYTANSDSIEREPSESAPLGTVRF